MSYFAAQEAIYQHLVTDAALLAAVDGRIYDHTPPDADFPLIEIGTLVLADRSADCLPLQEETFRIHVWSQYRGQKQVKQIADLLIARLRDVVLSVTGKPDIEIRFLQFRIVPEPDGLTYQGVLDFKFLHEG